MKPEINLKTGKTMKIIKNWENDKIQIELSRKDLESIGRAVDENDPISKGALVYNIERLYSGKIPIKGKRLESWKTGYKASLDATSEYTKRKEALKTLCKISGADCQSKIRSDFWGLKTIEDIKRWDNTVKTFCTNCQYDCGFAKTINDLGQNLRIPELPISPVSLYKHKKTKNVELNRVYQKMSEMEKGIYKEHGQINKSPYRNFKWRIDYSKLSGEVS